MTSREVDDIGMAELGDVIDRARERRPTTIHVVPPRPRGTSSRALRIAAAVVAVGAAGVVLSTREDSSTTIVPGTEVHDTFLATTPYSTEVPTTVEEAHATPVETTASSTEVPTTAHWDLTACTDQLAALVKQLPSLRDLPVVVFKELDGDGITWPACEVFLGDDPRTLQVGVSAQPISSRGPTGDGDETSERVLSTATLHVDSNGSLDLPNTAQAVVTFDDGLTVYVKAHGWTDFDARSAALDLAETLTGTLP